MLLGPHYNTGGESEHRFESLTIERKGGGEGRERKRRRKRRREGMGDGGWRDCALFCYPKETHCNINFCVVFSN